MKLSILLLAILCLSFSGCTEQQVVRAEQAVQNGQELLARAEAAEVTAKAAVEQAKALAEQLGSEKAKAIALQAEQALAIASDGVASAKAALQGAQVAADAAKAAQAAGGSTIDVLLAGLTAFLPAAGTAAIAIRKLFAERRALHQTVQGIDNARQSLPEGIWDSHLAPALAAAQDDAVKARVAQAQYQGR